MTVTINIHAIKENKGQQVDGTLALTPERLGLERQLDGVWQDIRFHYTVANAGDLFILAGKVSGVFVQPCSRCLKPVTVNVQAQVLEKFSRGKQHQPDDEDETFPVAGDELEVAAILRDCLVLELPLKVVCAENCRGLCPRCGTDFNTGSCQCGGKEVDPRLAVLKELIEKSKQQ